MTQSVKILINSAAFVDSKTTEFLPVKNPATEEVLAEVPLTALSEIDEAIKFAGEAFKTWKEVATPERARLFLKYQHLLKEHQRRSPRFYPKKMARHLPMPWVTYGGALK